MLMKLLLKKKNKKKLEKAAKDKSKAKAKAEAGGYAIDSPTTGGGGSGLGGGGRGAGGEKLDPGVQAELQRRVGKKAGVADHGQSVRLRSFQSGLEAPWLVQGSFWG